MYCDYRGNMPRQNFNIIITGNKLNNDRFY